jgi:hypothetical protein
VPWSPARRRGALAAAGQGLMRRRPVGQRGPQVPAHARGLSRQQLAGLGRLRRRAGPGRPLPPTRQAPLPAVPVWADELRVAARRSPGPPTPATRRRAPGRAPPREPRTRQAAGRAEQKWPRATARPRPRPPPTAPGAQEAWPPVAPELDGPRPRPRWRRPVNSKAGSAGAPTSCARAGGQGRGPDPGPRRPAPGRPQDAGNPAQPARAVEDHRPGRRAQPRAVEAFDEACTEAHKVVEAWLTQVRQQAEPRKAQRLALIDEVKAWTAGPCREHRLESPVARTARLLRALAPGRPPERKGFAECSRNGKPPCTRRTPVWKPPRPRAPRAARP